MPDNVVKLVLEAEDKASKVIKGTRDEMNGLKKDTSSFSDSLKNMAPQFKAMATAGGAVFGALSGLVYTSVKAFGEAEVAMARVNTILKNVQKETGATDEEMKNVSVSIELASKKAIQLGFDDEDLAESMAMLYQRTKDVASAQQLSGLAMDLARAKNIDLATATKLVNLALSGSGKALTAYGISIKDTATPMEALGILMEKVGGQAGAFADTFQGKMLIMKVQIQNIKEAIGKPFADAIMKLIAQLSPFIEKIREWIEANPELAQKIIVVGLAVSGLVMAIGLLGLALPGIIAGFGFLMGPLGIILAIIAGTTFVLKQLQMSWGDLFKLIEEKTGIITWFKEAWQKVRDFFGGDIAGLIDRVKMAIQTLGEILQTFVIGPLTAVWDFLVNKVVPVLVLAYETLMVSLGPALSQLWNIIQATLLPALQSLWETFETNLLPTLVRLWEALKPVVEIIGVLLFGALIVVINAIVFLTKVLTVALAGITMLIKYILEVALAVLNSFISALNGITGALKSIWEWAEKTWATLEKIINAMAKGIGTGIKKIGGVLGFQEGGIVPGAIGTPVPALVHGGEMIIPYGKTAGGTQNNYNITITGNTMLDEDSAVKMGDLIIKVLQRNIRI